MNDQLGQEPVVAQVALTQLGEDAFAHRQPFGVLLQLMWIRRDQQRADATVRGNADPGKRINVQFLDRDLPCRGGQRRNPGSAIGNVPDRGGVRSGGRRSVDRRSIR